MLASTVIGLFSLTGCTKNNTTTVNHPDSVYTSAWITLQMNPVVADSDFEENITAPAITSSILQTGVVLGYGAFLDNNNDTLVANALEFMLESFTVGNILLQGADNTGLWYRYVVIPGHVLTTKGLTPVQARSLSYAEVTKLLGLDAKKSGSPTIQ